MADRYYFPEDFVWGTAISAHQTEGYNTNSDWWRWEENKASDQKYPLEPSGEACDFYSRFDEDFRLANHYNQNAIRLSVEWSRIEPRPGQFDQEEINHYRNVLISAHEHGLKTFVTLHHFTNPVWFADMGGWHSRKSISAFVSYAKKCAEFFSDLSDAFITINEPQVYALQSYTNGMWPPNKINPFQSYLVQFNMIQAHWRAYDELKKIIDVPVGIAKNIVWYETDPYRSNIIDRTAARILNYLNDDFYIWPLVGKLDFLGLNYYFTNRVRNLRFDNPTDYVSDMGWWINPGGLGNILQKLKKYNVPLYITENGLADAEDKYRAHFIRDMLIACGQAVLSGVDLRGYFHWSLMDNYEWHQGFWPRFGLVEIDRVDNLKRKPRRSFEYYAKVCQNGIVEVDDN